MGIANPWSESLGLLAGLISNALRLASSKLTSKRLVAHDVLLSAMNLAVPLDSCL